MIDLPLTGNWKASIIAKTFTKDELCRAICYLELAIREEIHLGPEMHNLGISLEHNEEELIAIQRKLALAIQKQDTLTHTTVSARGVRSTKRNYRGTSKRKRYEVH